MIEFLQNRKPAVKIATIYLVFSVCWILLSDAAVEQLTSSTKMMLDLQNAKGLLFVFLSALLLFFIAARYYGRMQETLREKEEALARLTALNEAANEGLVDYHFETDTAVLNEQMRAFMGTASLRVKNFMAEQSNRVHPDDRERLARHLQDVLASDSFAWQDAYRYRGPEGDYRHVVSRGYLIREASTANPVLMVYAMQDVTDIREANARYYRQQIEHRQQLTREIVKAQETEKNRWAEELHDNVCQLLAVAKLWLEQSLQDFGPAVPLQNAQDMVAKALNDIRQLSASIKPPELSVTGLCEAVDALLENLKRFSGAAFHLSIDQEVEQRLQEEQKVVVYRIIQEQVNNTLKYADAQNVWVRVSCENDRVSILVKDDGRGFSPDTKHPGIGLKNIGSRLQLYGGEMSVDSAPGRGCALHAVFNLQ